MVNNKASKIFTRIGFSDIVVPKENEEDTFCQYDTYIVGYEDENGRECDEDGIYLDSND